MVDILYEQLVFFKGFLKNYFKILLIKYVLLLKIFYMFIFSMLI